jgi:hypothetical protein
VSEPTIDQLFEAARLVSSRVHAAADQAWLEQQNRERSMFDRFERGLSVWGAQGSRYEPTEEADDP